MFFPNERENPAPSFDDNHQEKKEAKKEFKTKQKQGS